ncbi:hypothetical protein D3C81_2018000 [compost metagenome]
MNPIAMPNSTFFMVNLHIWIGVPFLYEAHDRIVAGRVGKFPAGTAVFSDTATLFHVR